MDTLHFSAIARSESGLGGRWGPYRLDVGQKLVQVSEDAKQGLDEATKRKTQEMADAAYRQRQAVARAVGEKICGEQPIWEKSWCLNMILNNTRLK